MRTINIGSYEIMKPDRNFDYLYDMIKYADGLGDGWKAEYNNKLAIYIFRELGKLNVHRYILFKFSKKMISEIRLKYKGHKYTTTDPLEIKKFLTGFDATFNELAEGGKITISEYDEGFEGFEHVEESIYIVRGLK